MAKDNNGLGVLLSEQHADASTLDNTAAKLAVIFVYCANPEASSSGKPRWPLELDGYHELVGRSKFNPAVAADGWRALYCMGHFIEQHVEDGSQDQDEHRGEDASNERAGS